MSSQQFRSKSFFLLRSLDEEAVNRGLSVFFFFKCICLFNKNYNIFQQALLPLCQYLYSFLKYTLHFIQKMTASFHKSLREILETW